MPALTINSVDVPIAPDGHEEALVDLGELTRSAGGRARSNVTARRGRARVRPFRTPWLDLTTAATVLAELEPVGVVTANGYLVGGSPISALVRNLVVEEHASARYKALSFELHSTTTE